MDEKPIALEPGQGSPVKADRPELSLLEVTFERGRVHLLCAVVVHPAEQRGETGQVEGVRGTLALEAVQPTQLDVGEVEAVHRCVRDGTAAQA